MVNFRAYLADLEPLTNLKHGDPRWLWWVGECGKQAVASPSVEVVVVAYRAKFCYTTSNTYKVSIILFDAEWQNFAKFRFGTKISQFAAILRGCVLKIHLARHITCRSRNVDSNPITFLELSCSDTKKLWRNQ